MKTFPLNLKHFKKIRVDENSSTLRNKDGHEIKIAHSRLKPELKEQLDALPHYAEGTPDEPITVQDYNPALYAGIGDKSVAAIKAKDEAEAQQALRDRQTAYEQRIASLPKTRQEAQQMEAPKQQPSAQPSFDTLNKDQYRGLAANQPQPTNPMLDILGRATEQEIGALQEQRLGAELGAKAQAAGAREAANRLATENIAFQNKLEDYESTRNYLMDERNKLNEAIQNGHIDPAQWLNSQSTGNRIVNAISLIISGMGAGLTHTPNLAAQLIEKQIDQNIMAQKAELGKKENLLSHNLQMLGDNRAATDMLRLQHNDIVSNYLKQAALTTQNLQAAAQLHTIAGQFDAQSAQLQQKMAMQGMLFAGPQLGETPQAGQLRKESPAPYVQLFVPEKLQEQANKELGKLQEVVSLKKGVRDSFNDLASQVLGGAFSPADRQSAINAFAGQVARASAGRYNEDEAKNQLEALLPNRLESAETTEKKRARADKFFDTLVQIPTLEGSRIPVNQFEGTNLKAASFANKQRFKYSGGKYYMRGPNGEAIEVKP